MPLYQYFSDRPSMGDLIGSVAIVYKIVAVGGKRERTPSGNMGWKAQLIRASEDEETIFMVMES